MITSREALTALRNVVVGVLAMVLSPLLLAGLVLFLVGAVGQDVIDSIQGKHQTQRGIRF